MKHPAILLLIHQISLSLTSLQLQKLYSLTLTAILGKIKPTGIPQLLKSLPQTFVERTSARTALASHTQQQPSAEFIVIEVCTFLQGERGTVPGGTSKFLQGATKRSLQTSGR